MATPKIVKPCAAYFCWKPIIHGISIWHGSHQVAQKLTNTTLPFRLASDKSPPCNSGNVTSGSFGGPGLETNVVFEPLETVVPMPLHPANPIKSAANEIAAAPHREIFRFIKKSSPYREKRFRNVSLPESHVSRFIKISAPMASRSTPLKISTM